MLQGYPYQATGNSGTDVTATIYDPVLLATTTTVTIRGENRKVKIVGISPYVDTAALGMFHRVIVGNSEPGYRTVDVFPMSEADTATAPLINNFIDLGGYFVNEIETISITIVDAATANHSGILWVEDGEPTLPIPSGRIVTLENGGTNDATSTTVPAVTGFDKDSATLENGYTYTLFAACTRPEDKLVEGIVVKAGTQAACLPHHGWMFYPTAPLQFTGEQWNAGQVAGYIAVQAATKVETIMYLVETKGNSPSPNAPPIMAAPQSIPGAVGLADVVRASNTYKAGITRMR